MPTSRHLLGLFAWLLLTFAAAAIGGAASAQAGTFYQQLSLPAWAPPGWLFAPVWSALYFLMGIAAWLVWKRHGFGAAGTELALYVAQLVANALWTWLFFAWRLAGLAFAEILILWCLVFFMVATFWRIHRLAGALLMPYLAWLSFAAALNYAIWRLNPQTLY